MERWSIAVNSVRTMLAVSCLLLLAGLLWCQYQWRNRRKLQAAAKVPPISTTFPLIGHAYASFNGLEALTSRLEEWIHNAVFKGIWMTSLWLGPFPLILLLGRDEIQKALNSSKSSEKPSEYQLFEFVFGNGLLTAPGHIWRIKRRFSNQMFHQNSLDGMMSTFNRNSRSLVRELSSHVGREGFNILPLLTLSSVINMCNFLFGVDHQFKSDTEEIRRLEQVIQRAADTMTKRLMFFWLRFEPLFNFFYRNDMKEIKSVMNRLKTFSIKKKETLTNKEVTDKTSKSGAVTYLEALAAQDKEYPELSSDYDIQSDLTTLLLTGSDTVAVTVSSCILALGKHTEIQNQLFAEVESVMGEREEVTVEDLQKMTYLEQVFQETLRWGKIVPNILRRVSEDMKLGDVTLPADTTLNICIAALGVNPEVFPNPSVFNPEHFSAENRAARASGSFLPFSGGPRNCIGKRYAELLCKVMVIHVIRKCEITTKMDISSLKKKLAITLVNSEGYLVSLSNREENCVVPTS